MKTGLVIVPEYLRAERALAARLKMPLNRLEGVARAPENFYTTFDVPKKSGGTRLITPPVRWLRDIQRKLVGLLSPLFRFPKCVTGGIRGASHIDHAARHVGKYLVMTMDIRNFYPSTRRELVVNALSSVLPSGVAELIWRICSYKGGLPQGGPASMFLANLAFVTADRRLIRLCQRRRITYSRYVDDLAMSGDHDFRALEGPFTDIVGALGYEIAREKTRRRFRNTRQIVTGLVVNDCLRPTKEYRANVKRVIRNCIEFGPQRFADEAGLPLCKFKKRLTSQVAYIKRFDPKLGKQLQGLLCHLWRRWPIGREAAVG